MAGSSRTELRLIIGSWPVDAPRGAVTQFCREHGVSREWFYSVRRQCAAEGLPAALVARSRKPASSPNRTPVDVADLAVRVREQLRTDGWDHGPLSVIRELERMGVASPSRATLARLFNRSGLVVPEPRKRPRSSWKRFAYPAPNECWQMDATEWHLADGTAAAVFQLTDDHSRLVVASLAARSENAADALAVVRTGIARHGTPQRLLTDNGLALNPSRRGMRGLLPEAMRALGVIPISSTPGHPQTQGKNERIHSTLKRWLRARPRAATLGELQQQLDLFDSHYNTIRGHQSLDGATPAQAFAATPKATPPRPPQPTASPTARAIPSRRTVDRLGMIHVASCRIQVGQNRAGQQCLVLLDDTTIMVFDHRGTLIQSHPRPPRGTYIPNNQPRGFTNRQPSASPET